MNSSSDSCFSLDQRGSLFICGLIDRYRSHRYIFYQHIPIEGATKTAIDGMVFIEERYDRTSCDQRNIAFTAPAGKYNVIKTKEWMSADLARDFWNALVVGDTSWQKMIPQHIAMSAKADYIEGLPL